MLSRPCQVLFETIFDRQNKKQLLTFSVCFVPLFHNVSVYKVGFTPYVKTLYRACENEISSKSAFFQEIKNTKNYFRLFVRFFYKMCFISARHLPLIVAEVPLMALLFISTSIFYRRNLFLRPTCRFCAYFSPESVEAKVAETSFRNFHQEMHPTPLSKKGKKKTAVSGGINSRVQVLVLCISYRARAL